MSFYKILMSIFMTGLCIFSNAKVYSVKYEGLRLLTEERVESYLKIPLGEDLTQEDLRKQIKIFYDTGMFKQVAIYQQDDVLIVRLTEQPVIQKIEIDSKVSSTELKSNLSQLGIIKGELLNEKSLEEWRIHTQVSLKSTGFDQAKVDVELVDGFDSTVIIKIKVDTEHSTKISKVEFEGNTKIADFQLKRAIRSTESGLLSFLFHNNLYSDQAVEMDKGVIANLYRSKGYLNPEVTVKVEDVVPTQRVWNSNYKRIKFKIDEGPSFKVKNIHLSDDQDEWDAGVQNLLDQHMLGKVYSVDYMRSLDSMIRKHYSSVDPMAEYYDISFRYEMTGYDEIDLFLSINKDIKKVRFIDFIGNKTTLDEAFRRVIKVQEGQAFNQRMLSRSTHEIRGMSFVKSVNASDIAIEDDLYDIVFAVKEVNTFKMDLKIEMSGGWESLAVSVSGSDENILGTGNQLDLNFSGGFNKKQGMISYTIPNLNVDRHSMSFGGSFSTRNKDNKATSSYHVNQFGLSSSYFIPLGDHIATTFGGGYTHSRYDSVDKASKDVRDFFENKTDHSISQYKLTTGLNFKDIDSAYMPTTGFTFGVTGSVNLPTAEDIEYYELGAHGTAYFSLGDLYSQPLVLILSSKLKYANTYGSNSKSDVPFFARYYAGGLGTVRGYAGQSLGPTYVDTNKDTDIQATRAKGGNKLVTANVSLQLPSPNPDLLIPYLYVDYGNVFDDGKSVSLSNMRGSFGLSTVLNLPIGRFTLSYGMPFNEGSESFSNFSFGPGSIYN